MTLDQISDERLEEAANEIENHLSRSLNVVSVIPVEVEEVEGRSGPVEHQDFEVFFRVKIRPLKKQDVIETSNELTRHLRDQLETMELNIRGAPDTMVHCLDFPPDPNHQNPVYYIRSAM